MSRRALRCESTTAAILVAGLACLAMSCTSSRLSLRLSLCGLLWLSSKSCPATWSPLAQLLVVLLLLLVLRLDKSFSGSQPRIASLRPIRPQLLDGLQVLASPTNHHLVGLALISQYCAIIADALA